MASDEISIKYFLFPFFCIMFFFFTVWCIMVSMETNTDEQWTKNIWLTQDLSKNISIKVLSKYLKECTFA